MNADATFVERLVTHRHHQHLKMIPRAFLSFQLQDMDDFKEKTAL